MAVATGSSIGKDGMRVSSLAGDVLVFEEVKR